MPGVIVVILSPWNKGCWIAQPTLELPTSRLHLCKINICQDFCYLHPVYPDWYRCNSRNQFNEERWFARKRIQNSSGNRKSQIILFLYIIFIGHLKRLKWKRLMLIFHFPPWILPYRPSLCSNKLLNPAWALRPASTSAWIPFPTGPHGTLPHFLQDSAQLSPPQWQSPMKWHYPCSHHLLSKKKCMGKKDIWPMKQEGYNCHYKWCIKVYNVAQIDQVIKS